MTLQQLRYVTAVADAGTISRAALFNLLIGLNGYTICSGVISEALNGPNIAGTSSNWSRRSPRRSAANKNSIKPEKACPAQLRGHAFSG